MSIGKKMFPKKKLWARENPESPILTVRFDGDLKILGVFPISPPRVTPRCARLKLPACPSLAPSSSEIPASLSAGFSSFFCQLATLQDAPSICSSAPERHVREIFFSLLSLVTLQSVLINHPPPTPSLLSDITVPGFQL